MSEEKLKAVQVVSNWYITYNPEGSGLCLCVNRGISCENHTQVVSFHATNTPELETVLQVVLRDFDCLKKQIDCFVSLMQAMGGKWSEKESIGLLFCHSLIQQVSEAAEKLEIASLGSEPEKP